MGNKTIFTDIEKEKLKNEYRMSTLKGVNKLTRSDLDSIEFYAKTIDRTGNYYGLMQPRGGIAEVLTKYGYLNDDVHKFSGVYC